MASGPGQVEPGYELWRLVEPVAFDALRTVYRNHIDDMAAAEWLARWHARLWLRSAQGSIVEDEIAELERQIGEHGHDIGLVHDANAAVASEIAETLHLRYRRDLNRLGSYAITLDDLAYTMKRAANGLG